LISNAPIDAKYIRAEAQKGRMGARMLAIIAEGSGGAIYVCPQDDAEKAALSAKPTWKPDLIVPTPCHDVDRLPMYGMPTWGDAFTPRQLVALTTFADLVSEAKDEIVNAAAKVMSPKESAEYATAVATYLGLGIGRSANYWSAFTPWADGFIVQTFGRNAIRMVWDHAEVNIFSNSSGNWTGAIEWIEKVISNSLPARSIGIAVQADAQKQNISRGKIISTDPPYYDNIGYANLSDFFYVWLRRALKSEHPDLFTTLGVPKAEELVASTDRHGGKGSAERFFLSGMTEAMHQLSRESHPIGPVTIYYAFKQSETQPESGTVSTGWETFLEAVIRAGFSVTGTWPMRTERDQGLKTGSNVLASSIILVCRKCPVDAPTVSRREFMRELNAVLPEALDEMTKGAGGEHSPVAPVDLSQAIIGPGMAVFSKYAAVLEADGKPMSVRTALQLINRFFGEDDFDADTQFCLHWFEQNGWNEGAFGDADTLSRGKGTSVDGMKEAGVLQSGGGKVRLLKWSEYPTDWDPRTDKRTPIWEALHQLIRAFRQGGDSASGALLAALGGNAEAVRQLAYRLYTLCERLGQAEDARAYNELITSWTGIESAAAAAPKPAAQELPGFER
jgi:putative DNA methylase